MSLFRKPEDLFEGYIFDLDGTVYLGESLLPGAKITIETLRNLGKKTVFLSNKPTQTRQTYAEKLTRLGLPTPVSDVINSSYVMVDFLLREFQGACLFVIGEQPLINELTQAGFTFSEDAAKIDIVIASFDRTFAYRKLQIAFDAIRAGARFFATNADRYCPVPGGGEPDAAAMIAAIEACTDTKVEAVVGKPSKYMAEAILNILQLPPEKCIIAGDRLKTDVLMGLRSGMSAALVLTGADDAAVLSTSATTPTYVVESLLDLVPITDRP